MVRRWWILQQPHVSFDNRAARGYEHGAVHHHQQLWWLRELHRLDDDAADRRMTAYLSRSAWGARPANRESADRAETTHLFVHHSATAKPRTVEEAKAQLQAIQRDHLERPISPTNPAKWADAAYGIGVAAGTLFEIRGWDVKSGA